MQTPKKVVNGLLTAIVLSTGFLDYWAYSEAFYRQPKIWTDVVSGTGNAPNQYRIGVIDTAFFLTRHLHVGVRHALGLIRASLSSAGNKQRPSPILLSGQQIQG